MDMKAWNTALFTHLSQDAAPNRPLYLYVDRDVLADVAEVDDPNAATDSFCAAFQAEVRGKPFERALRDARMWRASGWKGEPPLVAVLAMTTLAVTEEPLGRPNGVYQQQNYLLGLPAEAVQPPGYADHVPELWKIWNDWLEGPGSWLGRPSAQSHQRYTNQGWARSQGLIRHGDRLLMEEYFSSLPPGLLNELTPEGRVREFKTWLQFRGERTRGLRDKIQDDEALEILSEALEDERERWLQGERRSRGRHHRVVRALLYYDEWEDQLDLAVPVDDRLTELEIDLGEGPERVTTDEEIRILTTGVDTDRILGSTPYEWPLRKGLSLVTSPAPAHVLIDDPALGGRIETRGQLLSSRYHLLVREEHVPSVAAVLDMASEQARPGPVAGWSWLTSTGTPQAGELLRSLGLGILVPSEGAGIELQGGLPLTARQYLSGGEPNLLMAPGSTAVLDGATTLTGPAALADEALAPGFHTVEDITDAALRFETVPPTRVRAVGTPAFWSLTNSHELLATPDRPPGPRVSGGLVEGVDTPHAPLFKEVRDRDTALVLDEEGGVFQVYPAGERWMTRSGLTSWNVDVMRSVRTMDPRPAFFVTLSSRGMVTAVEIPADIPLGPGKVQRSRRQDLVSSLVVQWTWVGRAADARRSSVLARALRVDPNGVTAGVAAPQWEPEAPARTDLISSQIPGNPYDTILEWLSERERAHVPNRLFADTWDWACRHHGHKSLAEEWRLALERLRMLGHLERDFSRATVHLAPPALVPIPSGAGLRLYTGARPSEVLVRLNDPDDPSTLVADAVSACVVSRTTQTIPGTQIPLGPTAIHLAATPGLRKQIAAGMQELGIHFPDVSPSDSILQAQCSVREIATQGLALEYPPSRNASHWQPGRDHERPWQLVGHDRTAGLYRYRTSSNKTIYAWRREEGAPLILMPDRHTGVWLDTTRGGRSDLLRHNIGKRLLFVPSSQALPHMISRALVLRTGFMPGRCTLPKPGRRGEQEVFRVYENVDNQTAELVASLLGQSLQTTSEEEGS